MNNYIVFNEECTTGMLNGIKKLNKAVSSTLGPKGRNVIIYSDTNKPFITNDGVTIASSIEFDDEIENIGASIVKEIAIKTNDEVGDGTTTSILLASSIYEKGLKLLDKGINSHVINKVINESKEYILKELDKLTIFNNNYEYIENVATISSGDRNIGKLIKKAYDTVGIEGTIIIEDTNNRNTSLEIINGMNLESGYAHSELIDENNNIQILDNINVLLTKDCINKIDEIIDLINSINKKLLVICDDYDEDIIEQISEYNKYNSNKLYIIKSPLYGDKRKEYLTDISYYLNGIICNNYNYDKTVVVKKVTIYKDKTILESENNSEERINYLNEKLKNEEFAFEKEIITKRIAGLKGKIAIIKVGGTTELEKIDNKMRIEDALYSVNSSIKYGVLRGGGLTLYNISLQLEKDISNVSDLEKEIYYIMTESLKEPLKKICENSGSDYNEVVNNINAEIGYNALTSEYVDMLKYGIIDSKEVVVETIKNSVSISTLLLLSNAIVINNKNNESKINVDNVL